ncbi:N-acetyltransferase [Bacillus salacetis]|uniref:N-acetyltransferase n=1 Tax=Bacillus salacetis TaxID=2315464 RepID=A0A3A1R593_9BACI|nr:GNAT family protein [Bacillus salacetis]RIW37266.1 N-acetyltransferase [Bacillus salacetis]
MVDFILDGEIRISLFQPYHAPELFQLVDDNREILGKWLSFPHKTRTIEDSRLFIERSLTRFENDHGFWAGIWLKDELAGAIGYLYMDPSARKTEIGYWLGRGFEGNGLVTKSCVCFVNHAFEGLELNKVEINMSEQNARSIAVAERLGFKREGLIRDFEFLNGLYHNRFIYGMLRKEWAVLAGTEC